jgi:Uma2 family endonuclease
MGANEPRIPFTYEDYKILSASADQRYELMDGDLLLVPAPSTRHQIVAKNLLFLLEQHVRSTGSGQVLGAPLDVVLGRGSERSVVQPDTLYVSSARLQIVTALEVEGAPDLVVEVLSPATAERDRGMKNERAPTI